MNDLISPRYQMKLVKSVESAIKAEYNSYKKVELYIKKWHEAEWNINGGWENFAIFYKDNAKKSIDLFSTLHNMKGEVLLKVAIDLGVETPDFIPSVPNFKYLIKSEYKTAYDTFTKAFKQIETDPSIAVGLANSALESIIKEIINDERMSSKVTGNETLYKLTTLILKEFNISNDELPREFKTIGSSLLAITQAIEKLRSEKTDFHGKTTEEKLITEPIFAYFIVNCVSTLGLFFHSYYRTKYPKPEYEINNEFDLPF